VPGNEGLLFERVVIVADDAGGSVIGGPTDAESASGDGTQIALLKRLRTLSGGGFAQITSSIARPANTTPYASGQAVGNAAGTSCLLTFSNSARYTGGGGRVEGGRLSVNSTNVTNAAFRLWLYSSTPSAPPTVDQTAFADGFTNRVTRRGYIDFASTPILFTANGFEIEGVLSRTGGLAFTATGTDLIGILEVRGAWTPTSGTTFYVSLDIRQN
jgi:hypothetical protein